MNKSEKFLNVSDEIPNTSKEITQWRKDNKIEGSIIKSLGVQWKKYFRTTRRGRIGLH